jgi:putative transposase
MSRTLRVDVGGEIYHCLNRAVGRQTIFHTDKDYQLFEKILQEVVDITGMRILAYAIMPNHFHLVLHPRNDGDLSEFMKRITVTHTQRYRVATKTVGEGSVYQGRYKSFIIQNGGHLFTVLRYVERNPFAANLTKDPLEWKYSSVYRRYRGSSEEKKLLCQWICEEPDDYLEVLRNPLSAREVEKIELSEQKGVSFGDMEHVLTLVKKYGLGSTMRGKGRPKKE